MWKIILSLYITSLALTACLPAAFTGASASAIAVAKDRSVKESWEDTKLTTKIRTAFAKNNFRELYTKINVEVVLGRVLITGKVDKEEDILNATKLIWDQGGVHEVINELQIDKNSSHFDLAQYTKDTMITTQIKSKTFFDREIKFVNYTVITFNNVVYLFGIARSSEELEKVADISSKIKGVEKVISHVRIKDQENLSSLNE